MLTTFLKQLIPAPLRRRLRAGHHLLLLPWGRRFGSYYCPVCQTRLCGFQPLSSYYSKNWRSHGLSIDALEPETLNMVQYMCPQCGAPDRSRLYALYLRERLVSSPSDFKLLDFAPCPALRLWIKHTFHICYRTADLLKEDVDDRVDLIDMAIYPTASVDAFICSHVLEHIPNDSKAMHELFRILKPGGWGILMVPIFLRQDTIFEDPTKATTEADRWHYFGQADHVRLYSKQGFIDRVNAAGFKIRQFGAFHFGEDTFRRCGLPRKSVLYVVEKVA